MTDFFHHKHSFIPHSRDHATTDEFNVPAFVLCFIQHHEKNGILSWKLWTKLWPRPSLTSLAVLLLWT